MEVQFSVVYGNKSSVIPINGPIRNNTDKEKGVEKLNRQAFLHIDVLGHVTEGHYD
jgi:hypothetical protein